MRCSPSSLLGGVVWLVFVLVVHGLSHANINSGAQATPMAFGSMPVVNFQTDAGGSTSATDNSAAFAKAVSLSQQSGLEIFVPPGTYTFTQSINSTDIHIFGAGEIISVFSWTQQLGQGVAAYDVFGDYSQIRQLGFQTSFGRPTIGEYIANFYGIRLNGKAQLTNVQMQYFYAGLVWNSTGGHTSSQYIHSSNNYYGLYAVNSNGDNFIETSGLEGNTFASVGVAASGPGIVGGDTFFRVHLCFGPYGVYQEGPYNSEKEVLFMQDVHFQLARFESCGNGAIYTENAGYNATGLLSAVELYNVGHSWNPKYSISTRAKDYAVVVGAVDYKSDSFYNPGFWYFKPGAKGIWNLGKNSSYLQ